MLKRQSTIDTFFAKSSPQRTHDKVANMSAKSTSQASQQVTGTEEPKEKKRKIEMTSSECLRMSATVEGTVPLTNPVTVQKTSRDVNMGLYPRNSRKASTVSSKSGSKSQQTTITSAIFSNQFKQTSPEKRSGQTSLGDTKPTSTSLSGQSTSKTLPGQHTPTKKQPISSPTLSSPKSCRSTQFSPSPRRHVGETGTGNSKHSPFDGGKSATSKTRPGQHTPTKKQPDSSSTLPSPKSCRSTQFSPSSATSKSLPCTQRSPNTVASLQSPKSWTKLRPSPNATKASSESKAKGVVRSMQAAFDQVASASVSSPVTGSSTKAVTEKAADKAEEDPNLLAFENDTEMEELMAALEEEDGNGMAQPNTFGLLGEEVQVEEEEEEEKKDYFEDLPDEIIENIFSQLPMIDLCLNVSRVCSSWNHIISHARFLPWKKEYHKLKLKDQATRSKIMQIMRTNNMLSERDSLLQLVRYMKNFTRRSNAFMVDHLRKHPKYEFAVEVIREKVTDALVDDEPNPWSLITMLVVLSETVKDIQLIIQSLLNTSSTTLTYTVIECLYCIATFLLALHSVHNLNRGIHYRVFYALYLHENVTVSTPESWKQSIPSGSGQQSLVSYGSGLTGGLNLTHEQLRIVKYEFEKNDIMKIMAFAGTGKTSTLIEYTKRRPNKQFLYVCYNKSVQEQAKEVFPWNVTCKTVHSLAFNTTGRRFVKQLAPDIKSYYVTRELPSKKSNFIRGKQVKETIESYLASADQVITTRHTPDTHMDKFGVIKYISHEEKMAVVSDAEVIWEKMQDPANWNVRMVHDGYLKMFQLMKPTLDQYDCILIDEGQDCTPAAQDILLRQDCPKILVGDPHQQIYSFRGARNAMREVPASHVFYLTQSFRFGPQIGYVASCLLEHFKSITEKTIVGNAKQDSVYGDSEGQMAIITRYNYTLFNEAVILANGETPQRIAFVGGSKYLGDLLGSVEDIFTLFCKYSGAVNSKQRLKYGAREIKHKFIKKFNSFSSLKDYANNAQDFELLYKIRIVETHHINIPSNCEKIRSRVARNIKLADIVLTTAHKAKGLEFDTVKVADDFLNMLNLSNTSSHRDLPEDELNLLYVAVTRAKKRLQMCHEVLKVLYHLEEQFMFPVQSSSIKSPDGEPLKCCLPECPNPPDLRNSVVLQRREIKLSTTRGKITGGIKCEEHMSYPPGFIELLKPKSTGEDSEEDDEEEESLGRIVELM